MTVPGARLLSSACTSAGNPAEDAAVAGTELGPAESVAVVGVELGPAARRKFGLDITAPDMSARTPIAQQVLTARLAFIFFPLHDSNQRISADSIRDCTPPLVFRHPIRARQRSRDTRRVLVTERS
jgi:hypothetical protein